MSEKDPADSLRDLDARLRHLREETNEKVQRDEDRSRGNMAGFGMALRLGTELVSTLIVGLGIGYGLDYWLGTKPWFLVVFFFLGAAAGVMNVYRIASGQAFGPQTEKDKTIPSRGPGGADDNNLR